MAERELFRTNFEPSKLMHPSKKFKIPFKSDPFLKIGLTFFSRYGELVPRVLKGVWLRITLYEKLPELSDAEKAQKISQNAWKRLEEMADRRLPLPK